MLNYDLHVGSLLLSQHKYFVLGAVSSQVHEACWHSSRALSPVLLNAV